jgi:hypothetical protein
MDYAKLIELVPAEKWNPLSEKLIGVILNSKKDDKMPTELANDMLLQMKNGTSGTKSGLCLLMEAAVLLDAEKTVTALGDMQLLKVAELIVQNMISGEKKNGA